jgi:thiol-disulfide isomerase/thioredoxin
MHFLPRIGYGNSKGENCAMGTRRTTLKKLMAGFAILACSGCVRSTGTVGSDVTPVSDRTPVVESSPTVEILSWDQTQKRREKLKGKVVVLDVWSTYCDPCVREFPNLVKLQDRLGDKVACISFNTDYSGAKDAPPESFRKPVLEFLTAGKARLFNVLSSDPSEELFTKIRLGGPPAVFVYDQQGMLVKRFDNSQAPKTPEFTYKHDVVPLVERLLSSIK